MPLLRWFPHAAVFCKFKQQYNGMTRDLITWPLAFVISSFSNFSTDSNGQHVTASFNDGHVKFEFGMHDGLWDVPCPCDTEGSGWAGKYLHKRQKIQKSVVEFKKRNENFPRGILLTNHSKQNDSYQKRQFHL